MKRILRLIFPFFYELSQFNIRMCGQITRKMDRFKIHQFLSVSDSLVFIFEFIIRMLDYSFGFSPGKFSRQRKAKNPVYFVPCQCLSILDNALVSPCSAPNPLDPTPPSEEATTCYLTNLSG